VKRLSIGLLAALLLSPLAAAQTRLATVTRVSDGDTLWVRMEDGGARRKLRLVGIDAPELCQPHGVEARTALAALVLGRRIAIESRYDDGYGRALAQVTLDGQDVARWLVTRGHAWSPGFRWHPGRYAEEQRRAQAARAGLWEQHEPMSPRDFRASHGPCR
jgi:micrococcal nuclease